MPCWWVLTRTKQLTTVVQGCHRSGDMAERTLKVLARQRGWCSSVSLAFFVWCISSRGVPRCRSFIGMWPGGGGYSAIIVTGKCKTGKVVRPPKSPTRLKRDWPQKVQRPRMSPPKNLFALCMKGLFFLPIPKKSSPRLSPQRSHHKFLTRIKSSDRKFQTRKAPSHFPITIIPKDPPPGGKNLV